MHHAIATISKIGNNFIADHVLVEPNRLWEYVSFFSKMPAWVITMQCPLELFDLRKNKLLNFTLGQARAQFDLVHEQCIHDISVDTSIYCPEDCALKIETFFESGNPSFTFKPLRKIGAG